MHGQLPLRLSAAGGDSLSGAASSDPHASNRIASVAPALQLTLNPGSVASHGAVSYRPCYQTKAIGHVGAEVVIRPHSKLATRETLTSLSISRPPGTPCHLPRSSSCLMRWCPPGRCNDLPWPMFTCPYMRHNTWSFTAAQHCRQHGRVGARSACHRAVVPSCSLSSWTFLAAEHQFRLTLSLLHTCTCRIHLSS